MSQYDFGFIDTAVTSGGDLASILAMWRDAILSNHSGTSRPGYVRPGQIWINTTTAANWVINLYDGANDVPLGYVNPTDSSGRMLLNAKVVTKTANATISLTEQGMTVAITATSANLVMTLPSTTSAKNGFQIGFIRLDATAFNVTITPVGGEFINGAASYLLKRQFEAVQIVSNGAGDWYVFGNPFMTTTDRLLGRSSAGAGPLEEIVCTAAGRALLGAADAAAQLSILGALTVATLLGQQTIYVPASTMVSRITNGAGSGLIETATNRIMLSTLDFDTLTQEFCQFGIQMPKSWDGGTLVCQFIWTHPTGTGGVAWQIQAVAFANDNPADTAFGAAVVVTQTGGTANDIYITDETAPMTVDGSPGPEEWVVFQVARVPANGSDTLAVDARLIGVKIHYTTSAVTDN